MEDNAERKIITFKSERLKFCATGQSSPDKIFYTAKYSPEVSDKASTESLEWLKQD